VLILSVENTSDASIVSKNDFQIVKVIGRGSFGKVYLVKHKLLGTYHAMKSVKKELVLKTDQLDGIRSKSYNILIC
jgi:serine/threonine protein kinase